NFQRVARLAKGVTSAEKYAYQKYKFALLGSTSCNVGFEKFFSQNQAAPRGGWSKFAFRDKGESPFLHVLGLMGVKDYDDWTLKIEGLENHPLKDSPFATGGDSDQDFAAALAGADPELKPYVSLSSSSYLGQTQIKAKVTNCDTLRQASRDRIASMP